MVECMIFRINFNPVGINLIKRLQTFVAKLGFEQIRVLVNQLSIHEDNKIKIVWSLLARSKTAIDPNVDLLQLKPLHDLTTSLPEIFKNYQPRLVKHCVNEDITELLKSCFYRAIRDQVPFGIKLKHSSGFWTNVPGIFYSERLSFCCLRCKAGQCVTTILYFSPFIFSPCTARTTPAASSRLTAANDMWSSTSIFPISPC